MDRTLGRNTSGRRLTFSEVVRHPVVKAMGVALIVLAVANCSGGKGRNKYGVKASPRVIADGQPVPKGGGRAQVGKPYVVAGRTYVPQENPNYSAVGLASWYGSDFHGRLTANGEIFDRYSVAAAHPTMPLPSYARVTNLDNNRSIIVRVNDRGPYHANRVMDVSQTVAEALDFRRAGTARVKVDYVGRASLNGSDDKVLLATLREDGKPAQLRKVQEPTMLASAQPLEEGNRSVQALPPRQAPYGQAQSGMPLNEAPASVADEGVPVPPQRPARVSGYTGGPAQTVGLYYVESAESKNSPAIGGPFASVSNKGALSLKR